jgi:pyridoxal phosphate phosphatase PHOSPHO2
MQWMAAVDHALLMLQTSQNLPVKTLQETVANVPIQKYMIDAVRYASSKESTDLHIVSDANTAYIGACLQKHNLSSCFTEIVTNPAYEDEGGRLRVKPFHNQTISQSTASLSVLPNEYVQKRYSRECA